jgi:hypothetical protein
MILSAAHKRRRQIKYERTIMFHNAQRYDSDRKITYTFKGPQVTDDDMLSREEWHDAIEVIIRHDKSRKAYTADIYKIQLGENNGGYTMKRYALFTDPSARILSESAARFSENKLNSFAVTALQYCDEIVGDADNVSLAAELLRTAQSYVAAAESRR